MNKRIICHIGFPKTGTTFLQSKKFKEIPEIQFLDNSDINDILSEVINSDDTIFNTKVSINRLNALIDSNYHTILLSRETLTGYHKHLGFVNRTLIAKRLKDLGINKIIITIRNQFDIVESAYKQYIKRGGVLGFKDYFGFNNLSKRPYFNLEYLNYYKIIDLYINLFGCQNVLILQYEDIQNSTFYKSLFTFLGITNDPLEIKEEKINPSLSYEKTNILSIINHFTYNSFKPSNLISNKISTSFFYNLLIKMPVLESDKSFITKEIKNKIHDYFFASNRAIINDFRIKLHISYPQ